MITIQTIPSNKLVHYKANVRKTGAEESIAELAASIAAVGLRKAIKTANIRLNARKEKLKKVAHDQVPFGRFSDAPFQWWPRRCLFCFRVATR